MKKGKFKISMIEEVSQEKYWDVKSGFVSRFLGIHKEESGGYMITHLPTGLQAIRYPFKYLKTAKIVVAEYEKAFPFELAEKNLEKIKPLVPKMMEIFDEHWNKE